MRISRLIFVIAALCAGVNSARSEPYDVAAPQDEVRFVQAATAAMTEYQGAPNELRKTSVKVARDRELRKILTTGKFKDWYGYLAEIHTTSDGAAYVVIRLPADNVTVKTWNNELSDYQHHTLIPNGSPLYEALASMSPGDTVKFSGRMFREGSLTEEGGMMSPEFITRFSSIEKVAPPAQ